MSQIVTLFQKKPPARSIHRYRIAPLPMPSFRGQATRPGRKRIPDIRAAERARLNEVLAILRRGHRDLSRGVDVL
jgi:hypothetical protein